MVVLNALNSPEVPDGSYFYNPQAGKIEVQWVHGIGSRKAAAPQARLMATVINGILTRKLPWGLILLGVFLVIAVEILEFVRFLLPWVFTFPISTTLAIFCGGLVRWLVEKAAAKAAGQRPKTVTSARLALCQRLIAAGGIVGLTGIAVKYMEIKKWSSRRLISMGNKSPVLWPTLTLGCHRGDVRLSWRSLCFTLPASRWQAKKNNSVKGAKVD